MMNLQDSFLNHVRQENLPVISCTADLGCFLFCIVDRRKQHPSKNRDDGNNDQQFYQRKSFLSRVHSEKGSGFLLFRIHVTFLSYYDVMVEVCN